MKREQSELLQFRWPVPSNLKLRSVSRGGDQVDSQLEMQSTSSNLINLIISSPSSLLSVAAALLAASTSPETEDALSSHDLASDAEVLRRWSAHGRVPPILALLEVGGWGRG